MLRHAIVALALVAPAFAMPSDLPWETYDCSGGKSLNVKFLSDGLAIGVMLGSDETKDTVINVLPVDEEKQAGFQPGIYKGDGDVTFTLAEDGTFALAGKDVKDGPYEACKANGKTIGGD